MNTLAKLASKLSFFKPKGYPIKAWKNEGTAGVSVDQPVKPNIGVYTDGSGTTDGYYITLGDPGVVCIPFIPGPGISRDATSPLNNAMFKEVGEICKLGGLTYIANIDASDLGQMYLAIESAYLCYNQFLRIYSNYRMYKDTNLYTVRALYEGMHLDYNDMLKHMPDVLSKITDYQGQLKKLLLPKKFTTINDHIEMTASIFKDRDLDKSALIALYPKILFKYDPTVPCCKAIDFVLDHPMTFNELCNIMDSLINALVPDEGVATLTAYVRKAYGESNCYQLHTLNWDSFAEPVYDEKLIKQIHNGCFLNYSSVTGMDITQEITPNVDAYLKWDPTFTVTDLSCNTKRVIDLKSNDPTEEEVYDASFFMWSCKVQTASGIGGTIKLGECSTNILCNPEIMVYDYNMILRRVPLYNVVIPSAISATTSGASHMVFGWLADNTPECRYVNTFNSMLLMSKLSCAPITFIEMVEAPGAPEPVRNKMVVYNALFLKYNYTFIEDEVLDKMLRARIAESWAFDA